MAIMTGERPERPTHTTFTDELWELMRECWNQERDGRPQMSEVLKVLNSITPLLPPDSTPRREDTNSLGTGNLHSPRESQPDIASGLATTPGVLQQLGVSQPPDEEVDHPNKELSLPNRVCDSPDRLDSFVGISDPSKESDSSEGVFGPSDAVFGLFVQEDRQLLRKLSSNENLRPHTHTFSRKILQEFIELLDEVGWVNTQNRRR